MGNTKNKRNPNANRGKYRRRRVSVSTQPAKHPDIVSSGNRIVNLSCLEKHLLDMTSHVSTCQGCVDNMPQDKELFIFLQETDRAGLASVLTSSCTGCQQEFNLLTSSKVKGTSGGAYWEVNLAAVWGQMTTGGGHKPLAETMAILGVPTMTKQSFMSAEQRIGEWWRDLFEESMLEAGREERQIAITNNSYHGPNQIPAVTVVVDGRWSKHSHRHSYNVKSGVAIIIGKATGKIMHMGVCNKHCYICSKHPEQPPPHKCFRNWESSSFTMESDIIVEGFKISEEKHSIRYTSFMVMVTAQSTPVL